MLVARTIADLDGAGGAELGRVERPGSRAAGSRGGASVLGHPQPCARHRAGELRTTAAPLRVRPGSLAGGRRAAGRAPAPPARGVRRAPPAAAAGGTPP